MGVYIKGAEMPKTCKDCRLFNSCLRVPRWADAETLDNLKVQRADNCPLVEVPEPHGRLIDADALVKFEDALFIKIKGVHIMLVDDIRCFAPTIIEGSDE